MTSCNSLKNSCLLEIDLSIAGVYFSSTSLFFVERCKLKNVSDFDVITASPIPLGHFIRGGD